jgi:hypothetical protein
MYTKQITFKKLVHGIWIDQSLKTTNDAIWLHHNQLSLRTDVKEIIVVDIV